MESRTTCLKNEYSEMQKKKKKMLKGIYCTQLKFSLELICIALLKYTFACQSMIILKIILLPPSNHYIKNPK